MDGILRWFPKSVQSFKKKNSADGFFSRNTPTNSQKWELEMLSMSFQNILPIEPGLLIRVVWVVWTFPLVFYGIGVLPKTIQSSNLSQELKRCYGWTKNESWNNCFKCGISFLKPMSVMVSGILKRNSNMTLPKKKQHTPWKFNMAPENRQIPKGKDRLPTIIFQSKLNI